MTRSVLRAELRPEQVIAIVDTREQLPVCLSPMRSEIGTLATGDYGLKALPHVVAIERKSETDFLACVGVERERFDREVLRLLAYPVRAIVIESTWKRIDTHERAGQFISRLLFIAARRRWRELRALAEVGKDAQ